MRETKGDTWLYHRTLPPKLFTAIAAPSMVAQGWADTPAAFDGPAQAPDPIPVPAPVPAREPKTSRTQWKKLRHAQEQN